MQFERECLLLLAKPRRSDHDQVRLDQLLRSGLEQTRLLKLVEFHGLEPAFWRAAGASTTVSAGLREHLRLANIGGTARNMKLVSVLLRIQDLLGGAGIPMLVLKGPVLAVDAYGDPSGRWFSDVDVVVRRADAIRSMELLRKTGLLPVFQLNGTWKERYLRRFYELTFREPDGAAVDLHWELLDPQFSFVPREESVWSNLRTVSLSGGPVQTLSLEMNSLYLCLHVAKHHWDRLGWLSDVAHWMVRRPEVDWARLGRDPATGRFVLITLGLIERLLEEPLPEGIRPLIEADAVVRRQIDSVDARLLRGAGGAVTRSAHWRTEFARAMPRSSDRWRSFYSTLFRPSVKEWRAVPLPEALSPLYAIIRPCRLLWKRVRRSGSEGD